MNEDIRAKAMAMLDRRQMSRAQLVKKLVEKGEQAGDAEEAADWLCEIGALNDGNYAEMLVRHYSQKGFGRHRIKTELFSRGIDRETADAALMGAEPSREAIDRFVGARLKGQKPDKKELQRLYAALSRRGHGYDEIKDALSRYNDALEEEQFD